MNGPRIRRSRRRARSVAPAFRRGKRGRPPKWQPASAGDRNRAAAMCRPLNNKSLISEQRCRNCQTPPHPAFGHLLPHKSVGEKALDTQVSRQTREKFRLELMDPPRIGDPCALRRASWYRPGSSQVDRSSEIPAALEVLINADIRHLLQKLLERGTERRWCERLTQNLPMLLLGGLPVPGRTKLQLFYKLVFNVSHN